MAKSLPIGRRRFATSRENAGRRRFGRRLEHHLVVLPELLEQPHRTPPAVANTRAVRNLPDRANSIDRVEHSLLLPVNRQNQIGILMTSVQEHCRSPWREPFL